MSTAVKEPEQEIITPLSLEERSRLKELEDQVGHGMAAFVEIGNALREIRDSKLYRSDHRTFDDYVQRKWKFSRQRAYQLMDASEVATSKECQTLFDKSESKERAAIEISKVPEKERPKLVKELKKVKKETGKVTSGDVQRARGTLYDQVQKAKTIPKELDTTQKLIKLVRENLASDERVEARRLLIQWFQEHRIELHQYPTTTLEGLWKRVIHFFE